MSFIGQPWLLKRPLPAPSLDLNFLATTLDPRITFTRAAGPATYFDSTGTLQTVGTNVARFDCDPVTHAPRGLLIEEARTNSIRNSTMVGAAAGTPGTIPSLWGSIAPSAGITSTIVGTGTESGIAYIDVRFSGTPSSGAGCNIVFEGANAIVAATGQTWTGSAYARLVGGAWSNASLSYGIIENTTGGVFVGGAFYVLANATSAALATQRQTATRVLSGGGTVGAVQPVLSVGVSNGLAIDLTLRIGAPQLELGASATSFVPTTAAVATRAADVPTMPVGGWFTFSQGTLAVTALQPVTAGKATTLAAFTGPSGKTGLTVNASNQVAMFDTTGAINTPLGAEPVAATFKAGFAWQAGSQSGSLNGGLPVSAVAPALTAGNTTLSLGYDGTSQQPSGSIRRVRYWPRALGAAELQAVTR